MNTRHVYFFQWNIPQDNHYLGRTDWYINIIAEWSGRDFIGTKPMVSIHPVNIDFVDLRQVKNWELASRQITEIAETHFADLARQERINKARAELIAAGEMVENPILIRYESNVISELPYIKITTYEKDTINYYRSLGTLQLRL